MRKVFQRLDGTGAASIRVARWGHWGRPILWLGPCPPDHLQPARVGLVDALGPRLSAGRIKLYACDRDGPSLFSGGAGGWAAVLQTVAEDCGHTPQAYGMVVAGPSAEPALGWARASRGRVDRLWILGDEAPLSPTPGLQLRCSGARRWSEICDAWAQEGDWLE